MRKIIHTIFALILLVSTTGITINLHYCHEHLYDVGLNKPARSCCDNGGNDNSCHHGNTLEKPCHCKNESITVKLSDNFLISSDYFETANDYSNILFYFNYTQPDNRMVLNNSPANPMRKFSIHPPPQKEVLLKLQSFLI